MSRAIRNLPVSRVRHFSPDKIYKHPGRVNAWIRGHNPFAITVELDASNKCNHRCPECFGYAGNARDAMVSKRDLFSIVAEIAALRGCAVTFTGGGEPMVNRYTVDAIAFARRKGLDVALITNGSLMNEGDAEWLVKACTWIRVSLDAGTPEMHEWTHGVKNQFEQVVNNIRLLVEAKKRLQSNCTIGTGYLTGDQTLDGMVEYARLSGELGVDYCQFRPYVKVFSGKNALCDDSRKIYERIEQCFAYRRPGFDVLWSKHKYDDMWDGAHRGYEQCYGQQFTTFICADLKVYVCCHFAGLDEYCIGDLAKDSLREIWESEQRLKAVSAINLDRCPRYCRCHGMNKILWRMMQPVEHENFL